MTLDGLQKRLGYRFKEPALLQRALTHSSYRHEQGGDDNERLEFLGDAVLDLAVSALLCRTFPTAVEGELSALRSRLVNTDALAAIARRYELGSLLRLGRGEESTGGRDKASILEGAVESVLGAIFLDARDAGWAQAERVARSWVADQLATVGAGPTALAWKDPKSRLQEVVQRGSRQAPTYHAVRQDGPDHRPSFHVEVRVGREVLGYGQGSSKREAERNAAECALVELGERGDGPAERPGR